MIAASCQCLFYENVELLKDVYKAGEWKDSIFLNTTFVKLRLLNNNDKKAKNIFQDSINYMDICITVGFIWNVFPKFSVALSFIWKYMHISSQQI